MPRRIGTTADDGATLGLTTMPAVVGFSFVGGPVDGACLTVAVTFRGPPYSLSIVVSGATANYTLQDGVYVHRSSVHGYPVRPPCRCGAVTFSVAGSTWLCAAGCPG